eukprot:scaffold19798_cov51-Attheya_sp.AAC.5
MALEIGDNVCIEGYIMDLFCINRGTLLLENSSVTTLRNPERHSVHCIALPRLVDVGSCRRSGYELLLLDLQEQGGLYARLFRFDDIGN